MKNVFTSLLIAFLFLSSFTESKAQQYFEFCGSTFVVNCDGTVDVDLADNVQIYKVWNGSQLVAELNNFTSAPNVIYTPFNSADPGFGNPVPPGQNFYLDVQTSDCGQFILNISDVLAENCDPDPTCFEFCGSTFKVNCDGTVDVDLATNVQIYKVWNGSQLVAELNNFTSAPNVIYTPFNSADPGFGNPVPPGQNFYLDVQTSDCGQFILNISKVLSDNCPNFPLQGQIGSLEFEGEYSDMVSYHNLEPVDLNISLGNSTIKDLQVDVYPNPAVSEVQIALPEIDATYDVSLYNLNGRLVLQASRLQGKAALDVNNLASGIYLLDIQGPGYSHQQKLQVLK